MKKRIKTFLIILMFLSGLSLLLYPLAANKWNTYRQNLLITTYDETVAKDAAAGKIDYTEEWNRARAYNEALLPCILPDSFAEAAVHQEPDREYLACLNLSGDGIMGLVEIPKINIKLPIYHTTDEENLQKGAGHLEGSSLPSGGKSTHAVISAHRGLPSASLFTDLDKLEKGDHFLLYILDETLCYEVDNISTVEPQNTQALNVEDGKDLVTLLTCTPYGVNSHRLLVRGHRVPYEPLIVQEEENAPQKPVSLHTDYLLWVKAGLGVTGAFILFLWLRERKSRHKKGHRNEEKK